VLRAYWDTFKGSGFDWFIIFVGLVLLVAHVIGLALHYQGTKILFVQGLERYRTLLLLWTELLPILGMLGTVIGLMNTFSLFQMSEAGEGNNLSATIRAFAPAMSTTISGLIMVMPNLLLNSVLWLVAPTSSANEKDRKS